MITKLASLAREIRAVIPGTESVTVYETGNIDVHVRSDDDVAAFASAASVQVRQVEAVEVTWLSCHVKISNDASIIVSGPNHDTEAA